MFILPLWQQGSFPPSSLHPQRPERMRLFSTTLHHPGGLKALLGETSSENRRRPRSMREQAWSHGHSATSLCVCVLMLHSVRSDLLSWRSAGTLRVLLTGLTFGGLLCGRLQDCRQQWSNSLPVSIPLLLSRPLFHPWRSHLHVFICVVAIAFSLLSSTCSRFSCGVFSLAALRRLSAAVLTHWETEGLDVCSQAA